MSDWDWLDWFPIVLLPLKIIVVGIGWYYSVKWHYEQDQKKKNETLAAAERAAAARAAAEREAAEQAFDAPDVSVTAR